MCPGRCSRNSTGWKKSSKPDVRTRGLVLICSDKRPGWALLVLLAAPSSGCHDALDAKAHDEALIAAGHAPKDAYVSPAAAKARAIEAAAEADIGVDLSTLESTPGPPFNPGPDVEGRRFRASDFECRPGASPDFCADATASLAADANSMVEDLIAQCQAVYERAVEARRKLEAGPPELQEDPIALVEQIERDQRWIRETCY